MSPTPAEVGTVFCRLRLPPLFNYFRAMSFLMKGPPNLSREPRSGRNAISKRRDVREVRNKITFYISVDIQG